jgi:quercetin dioxygenase-like cupin family protein
MATTTDLHTADRERRRLLRIATLGLSVGGLAGMLRSRLAGAANSASMQLPGITRSDLLQRDLSVPGREAVQALVNIAPGGSAPRHSHPGEDIAFVTEGVLEDQLDGMPPVTVKAGEALFIPNGVIHAVKNVGSGNGIELATYFVEKGKPLFVLAQ